MRISFEGTSESILREMQGYIGALMVVDRETDEDRTQPDPAEAPKRRGRPPAKKAADPDPTPGLTPVLQREQTTTAELTVADLRSAVNELAADEKKGGVAAAKAIMQHFAPKTGKVAEMAADQYPAFIAACKAGQVEQAGGLFE